MRRNKSTWKFDLPLYLLILLALVVFGGVAYGVLHILTDLPAWLVILISVIVAFIGFGVFIWTHSTNGFDGIYGKPPGVFLGGGRQADDINKRNEN